LSCIFSTAVGRAKGAPRGKDQGPAGQHSVGGSAARAGAAAEETVAASQHVEWLVHGLRPAVVVVVNPEHD